MTAGSPDTAPEAGAAILRLKIERFRGFKNFDWRPEPGLNVVLGAGDAGKTTLLEAIGLLLNPSNATLLTDNDYWRRDRTDGFFIGAVISLPISTGVNTQAQLNLPWEWDGRKACKPHETEDGSPAAPVGPPVYKVAVRGTDELDLQYEILNPNGTTSAFTPQLRRAIGMVRLGGDDRNDRDLRLIQGSALDRLVSDKSLRARLVARFSDRDVKEELDETAKTAIADLDKTFERRALPHDLGLGVGTSQGQSLTALIGLTAAIEDGRLPLSSWGSGTRRLASLAVAQACKAGCPITLVDEAERGLEPYRQRKLVAELAAGPSQVVMTTHSGPALAAAVPAAIWHLSKGEKIGRLASARIDQLRGRDPEAFLARLAIVGEGPTEVGFVEYLLEQELDVDLLDLGIRLCDAEGNDFALEVLEELEKARVSVAAFVDCEGKKGTRWSALKSALGDLLFQWEAGCTESNVITHVPNHHLEALIEDPEGVQTQARLNTLADRIIAATPDVQPHGGISRLWPPPPARTYAP